jgi:MYXO-CTERM domain-containing protein
MGTPPVSKDVPCLVCDDTLTPTNPPPPPPAKSGCSIGTTSAGALGAAWLVAIAALKLRRRKPR